MIEDGEEQVQARLTAGSQGQAQPLNAPSLRGEVTAMLRIKPSATTSNISFTHAQASQDLEMISREGRHACTLPHDTYLHLRDAPGPMKLRQG